MCFAQTPSIHSLDTVSLSEPHLYRVGLDYTGSLFLLDPEDGISNSSFAQDNGIGLRIIKETYGAKKWQQLFHYPEFGLGLYQGFFYLPNSKPGYPTTVYSFFNAPFKRRKNWESRYELSLGLSFNLFGNNPPGSTDQVYNGSTENVRFTIGYENRFILSPSLKASLGLNFIHYSNGYTHSPNPGYNSVNLVFALRYGKVSIVDENNETSKNQMKIIENPLPEFKSLWEFYGLVSGGWKTVSRDAQNNEVFYPIFSVSTDVAKHYSFKGKLTVGADLFHDGSLVEEYEVDYGSKENVPSDLTWYYGLHIGHEWMIHRLSIITQFGMMLKDVKGRERRYGRLAFRYDIGKHLFARVGLKLPSQLQSDFLEWGIGYAIYK